MFDYTLTSVYPSLQSSYSGVINAWYGRFSEGDRLSDKDPLLLPSVSLLKDWRELYKQRANGQAIDNFDYLVSKLVQLNKHFLPTLFQRLHGENPFRPSVLVGRFAMTMWECDLMHGARPRPWFLKQMNVEEEYFHRLIQPLALGFAKRMIAKYTDLVKLQEQGLTQQFFESADKLNFLAVRGMDHLHAMAVLNCLELAGIDLGDMEYLNQMVQLSAIPILNDEVSLRPSHVHVEPFVQQIR